jgi:hypothetical protein
MALDIQLSQIVDAAEHIDTLFIKDDIFVTGSYDNQVRIYDISDPSNPILLSDDIILLPLDEPALNVKDIHIEKNLLFVGSVEGVEIHDISDPSNPVMISNSDYSDNNVRGLYVSEYVLAFGGDKQKTEIYDISDPSNPQLSSTVTDHTDSIYTVFIKDNVLVTGSNDTTVNLYDISDPSNPSLLTTITESNYRTSKVFIKDNVLYVGCDNGISYVYDIIDPSNPELITDNLECVVKFVDGNLLIGVLDSVSKIYDISDPSNPVLIFKIPSVSHVFIEDNILGTTYSVRAELYDISRFKNDFIDITFANYPEIRFRGNPLKTDNTITEIEVYVNETLENSYTNNLDQIKTLTINTPDLVDGDNWITILGYDDQGNESAATVLISDDYFSATNFEYDQENYRFVMPDNKLHAEAAWGKHDVGFITDGIRFFQDRSIIEMIPVVSNASSGDTTINLKRIGRVETEVVN